MLRLKMITGMLVMTCLLLSPVSVSAAEQLRVYLVRHAERVDQTPESVLTELGETRAEELADLLKGELFTHIYSTPYNRTILTAKPVADQQGLPISEYDAGDLSGFAEVVRGLRGVALVVGHSNTTPILVNHLIGTEFPYLEDHVYDRVYVVSLNEDGSA